MCGGVAKRETDTLDTFVCSSWYYLRYFDAHNEKSPWTLEHQKEMMPVDLYVGGIEHAAMHLLYARFIYKALRELNMLDGDEPFQKLIHQGVILGSDGQKMSKSKGNTVLPDSYIEVYGADVFRTYLAFGFSYTEGGPWSDNGIVSIANFFKKISKVLNEFYNCDFTFATDVVDEKYDNIMNRTIKVVTDDVDRFSFNTAIARLMEYRNAIAEYQSSKYRNRDFESKMIENLVLLLSPFAPHFAEEIWLELGHEDSIFNNKWPCYDKDKIVSKNVELVVQINGKLRSKIQVDKDLSQTEVEKLVFADSTIASIISDKKINKIIFIPNRLVNIVF